MAKIDLSEYGYNEKPKKEPIDLSEYGYVSPLEKTGKFGGLKSINPNSDRSPNDKNKENSPTDTSMRKFYGSSIPGRAVNAASIMGKDILKGMLNYVNLLTNQGKNAVQEFGEHPLESLNRLGYGVAKNVENIGNIPRNLPSIASHLELSDPNKMEMIQKFINKYLPRFDFAKYAKPEGEERPGQELIEKTGENLIPAYGIGKLAKTGLSLGSPKIRQAVEESKVAEYSKSLEEAAEEHQKQLAKQESAISEAELETGRGTKPSKMQHDIGKKTAQLGEEQQELEDLNNTLEQQKNLPEVPKIDLSDYDKNVKNAENSVNESKNNLENVNKTHEQANENLENHDSQTSKYLGKGRDFNVRASGQIKEKALGMVKELSDNYEKIISGLEKEKVTINNEPQIKQMTDKMVQMVKEGKIHTKEFKELNDQLFDIENMETTIPASKYLSMLKSAKGYLRDMNERYYTPGINEAERIKLGEQIPQLESNIEQMNSFFENSIPKEFSNELKKTNAGWRNIAIPLQRNSNFNKIKREGNLSENIMDTLIGTDPGDVIMKNIIKSDPEILKNVIGQKYAEKPHEIPFAGERYQEYIDQLPELKEMANNRINHEVNVARSKQNLESAEKRHKEIEQSHKNAIEEQKSVEDKKQEALKEFHEKRSKQEESYNETQKYIDEQKKKISNINSEIEKSKNHLISLQKAASDVKQSKSEYIKAQKALKDEKERIRGLKKDLDSSKGVLIKLSTKAIRYTGRAYRKAKGIF